MKTHHHRNLLLWLSAIFALRVLLQLILNNTEIEFLPDFDLWHSDSVSYSTLLLSQLVILALMLAGAFALPTAQLRPRLGNFYFYWGWLYVIIMIARLAIGAFDLNDHHWFDGVVSNAFHFVLAAYLIVLGDAYRQPQKAESSKPNLMSTVAPYPCIVIIGYCLFFRLLETGSPLMFSAYLVVLLGATAILIHETLAPYREEWRPQQEELVNDGLFLIFVQIAIPAILKALSLGGIVWLSRNNPMLTHELWPHDAPILVQVAIMLVVAEFFRYWIHRASHHYKPLWKLHAVHHAASKLYIVNVGRFHPLDKSIQFLGDTLPFLLLGISAEVFAAYFVFYGINGFYQHSNATVKLGWLNHLIAGPELHRWHHSARLSEAKSNFGNNLIIWDTVFGTRYLPVDKPLHQVGISNKKWPTGFFRQITAPFTTSTEADTSADAK